MNKFKALSKKEVNAFTLIELLVVVVIIGILATLTMVGLNVARGKSRDARRIADIRQIRAALDMFYLENGSYPEAITANQALAGITGNTYISKVPAAFNKPDGGCASDTYVYTRTSANAYELTYCLGNNVSDVTAGDCTATQDTICAVPAAPVCDPANATDFAFADTGANDLSQGDWPWTSTDLIVSDDDTGSNAAATVSATSYSQYLKATNFGFSVPPGATITGVEVVLERVINENTAISTDEKMSLIKSDGTYATTNRKNTNAWRADSMRVYESVSYGGECDTWGETLASADVNDTDFGIVLQVKTIRACFTGDTLVSTPSGYKKIADMAKGDLVLSFDENRQIIESTVSGAYYSGDQPTIKVMTNAGDSVEGTANHAILTSRGYLRIDQLSVGEIVYIMKNNQPTPTMVSAIWPTGQTKPVYDIEVNDTHTFMADNFLVHNPIGVTANYIDFVKMKIHYDL